MSIRRLLYRPVILYKVFTRMPSRSKREHYGRHCRGQVPAGALATRPSTVRTLCCNLSARHARHCGGGLIHATRDGNQSVLPSLFCMRGSGQCRMSQSNHRDRESSTSDCCDSCPYIKPAMLSRHEFLQHISTTGRVYSDMLFFNIRRRARNGNRTDKIKR